MDSTISMRGRTSPNLSEPTELEPPPHNADAELGVIGSLLFLNSAIGEIANGLRPEHFYFRSNECIYASILRLHEQGIRGIDAITIADDLTRRQELELIGGAGYLAKVLESVPHATHVRYYADIVRTNWQRRMLISRCALLQAEARRPDSNIEHLVNHSIAVLEESGLTAAKVVLSQFGGQSAEELWDLADQPVEWLVDDVFSCDQPTIFGAKQKSLKTTLLTDLAVSLATGFPWLGRFNVPKKRRVLLLTGEASPKAAIRRVKRAALARNLTRADIGDSIRIEAKKFPNLPSRSDCDAVASTVKKHRMDVVVLDPLYMGLQGLNTANLTEVGPAMRQFMVACQPANVIIAHHVKKSASFDDAPDLEDLSQAGIAEFAGNYWLMGRVSKFTGGGLHSLAIRYGGRDEQFGLLKLDFDELNWKAEFTSLGEHKEDQKQRRDNERVGAQMQAVRGYLSRHNGQATLRALAEAAATKPNRESFQRLVDELCESGQYERFETKSGNNKVCEGLRIKGQKSTDTVL